METTGIDLTKCNNCLFRAVYNGRPVSGTVKVGEEWCNLNFDGGIVSVRVSGLPEDSGIADFEIVPRDPETYKDWQVGDKVCEDEHRNACYEVIFRSGELVVFKDWNNWASNPMTCSEAFTRFGLRLVLTDIEQQIIAEKKVVEDIPKPYEFRKGEPVLVRVFYDKTWGVGLYDAESNNVDMPYWVYVGYKKSCYSECIPLNERTMHLLGTAEDYKEEQL